MDSQIDTGFEIPEIVELRQNEWGYPIILLDILDAEEENAFRMIWSISDIQYRMRELMGNWLFDLNATGKMLDNGARRANPPIRFRPSDKVRTTVTNSKDWLGAEIRELHDIVSESPRKISHIDTTPIGKLVTSQLKVMYLLMGKTAETTGVYGRSNETT